jgi:murein L,D-transpeptidase YcbB/YkuD
MKLGFRGQPVTALRQRLIQSGDLDRASGGSTTFDSFVDAAVRRFQRRHGLNATGVVSGDTIKAMNVPADIRLKQLELNVARIRSLSTISGRYVLANLPAAAIETVDNGVVATRHVAVVGKIDRQSPIMSARVIDINFHPYWTVPASIIRKDLIPKMQKEPNYLTEQRIRIYNPAGQEVPPQSINWHSMDATKYRFRQDYGDFNSMGTTRINIANPHGVYMHDTNSKGLFGEESRFHSSGCIRVQNVKDFVAWLLKETPGWDRARVEEAMRSGQRLDQKLVQPVPVHWVYVTAWADPGNGSIQFRSDIYGRDGLGSGVIAADARRI